MVGTPHLLSQAAGKTETPKHGDNLRKVAERFAAQRQYIPLGQFPAYRDVFSPESLSPAPQQPTPGSEERGLGGRFWDQFVSRLGAGNAMDLGAGLRAAAVVGDNETLYDMGATIEDFGQNMPKADVQMEPLSWDKLHINIAETIGGAFASFAPLLGAAGAGALAGGRLGALAGPKGAAVGAVAGGAYGAFQLNYLLQLGNLLREVEGHGVLSREAVQSSAKAAALMAGIDTAALGKVLGVGGRQLQGTIAKKIAQGIARGMAVEGTAESIQDAIQQATVNPYAGQDFSLERVAEAAARGAIGGGALGAVSGAVSGAPFSKPSPQDDPASETGGLGSDFDAEPPPSGPAAAPSAPSAPSALPSPPAGLAPPGAPPLGLPSPAPESQPAGLIAPPLTGWRLPLELPPPNPDPRLVAALNAQRAGQQRFADMVAAQPLPAPQGQGSAPPISPVAQTNETVDSLVQGIVESRVAVLRGDQGGAARFDGSMAELDRLLTGEPPQAAQSGIPSPSPAPPALADTPLGASTESIARVNEAVSGVVLARDHLIRAQGAQSAQARFNEAVANLDETLRTASSESFAQSSQPLQPPPSPPPASLEPPSPADQSFAPPAEIVELRDRAAQQGDPEALARLGWQGDSLDMVPMPEVAGRAVAPDDLPTPATARFSEEGTDLDTLLNEVFERAANKPPRPSEPPPKPKKAVEDKTSAKEEDLPIPTAKDAEPPVPKPQKPPSEAEKLEALAANVLENSDPKPSAKKEGKAWTRKIGKMVDAIVAEKKWNKAILPEIEVLADQNAAPAEIAEGLAKISPEGRAKAVYQREVDSPGKILIFADQIENKKDLTATLAHEVVGHFGVEQMLGLKFNEVLTTVLSKRDKGLIGEIFSEVEATYPQASQDMIASEVIARMAEMQAKHPLLTKIKSSLAKRLKEFGLNMPGDKARVDAMIESASRRLQEAEKLAAEVRNNPHQQKVRDALDDILFRIDPKSKPNRYVDLTRPVESFFRLLTIPLGGLDQHGNLRLTKSMIQGAGKAFRDLEFPSDSGLAFLNPTLRAVRWNWLNRHGLPEGFLDVERERDVTQNKIMMEVDKILKIIEGMNLTFEQHRALQDVLEGKQAAKGEEALADLAKPIRESLDALGKRLVDLGLLKEETYKKNIGSWLHRSYKEKFLDETKSQRRRRALRGDALKRRGRTQRTSTRFILNQIGKKNADALRAAKSIHVFQRQVGDRLQRVYLPSNLKPDVLPSRIDLTDGSWTAMGEWNVDSISKNGEIKLHRDWTKEEREGMGEIRDARVNIAESFRILAEDIANGEFFKSIAENSEWFRSPKERPPEGVVSALEAEKSQKTMREALWVQIPDTKIPKTGAVPKWGALAGGYLHPAIYRDLIELHDMGRPTLWRKLLREWKANKTARSPTVHFNNITGNIILSQMYDLRTVDLARAFQEMRGNGAFYLEASMNGVFGKGYVPLELKSRGDNLDQWIKRIVREEENALGVRRNEFQKTWDFFKSADRKLRDLYRWEDEIFRLASYIRDRRLGFGEKEAAINAVNRFLNYDIRAPWPNKLRNSVLPFLSYTYALTPQLLKAIASRPWKVAKLFALGYAIEKMASEISDIDVEELRKHMRDDLRGYTWTGLPLAMILPFRLGKDALILSLSRVVPGGDFLNFNNPLFPWMPTFAQISGPIDVVKEILSNRISYTGRDIWEAHDTNAEKTQKILMHLWRFTMPNMAPLPGTWAFDNIKRSIKGETDLFGNVYPLSVALIRAVGPRIYPMNVTTAKINTALDIQRKIRDQEERLYLKARDFSKKRISQSAFDREIAHIKETMKRLMESAKERFSP